MNAYTTRQVAQLLCVSERTIERWCDRGLMRYYRSKVPRRKPGWRRINEAGLREAIHKHALGDAPHLTNIAKERIRWVAAGGDLVAAINNQQSSNRLAGVTELT